MSDTTQKKDKQIKNDAVQTPEAIVNDIANSVTTTVNTVVGEWTVTSAKQTFTQVTDTIWKVWSIVWDQVDNFSEKVWWEEFVWEVKDIVNPISALVIDLIKIAFFVKKQDRVNRGQYIVGSLSVIVLVWLFVSFIWAILWPVGVWVWTAAILVPLFNIAVKRFHDLGKPGRWSLTVLLPLIGWIMPALFTGDKGDNAYGKDPLEDDKTDMVSYLLTGLSLFIVSSMVVTALWFLWIRVSTPSVDITDPNYIDQGIVTDMAWQQTDNVLNMTDNALNNTTNTVDSATQFR